MRTYPAAILALLLPLSLEAQTAPFSVSFLLSPPGITTRLERFEPLSYSGGAMSGRLTMDSRGFLWCLTNQGLARFDGYELKLYREDLADTAGIFQAQMQAIAVDGEGFVWGGTSTGGLVKLDPVTGRSRWYRGRDDDSTSIGEGTTRLLAASDGTLWAGGKLGLSKYDRRTDSFIRYTLPPDWRSTPEDIMPAGYPITSICELGRSIWVGLVRGGLAELNRETGTWKRYTQRRSSSIGPSHDIIRALCSDPRGRLWIGTRDYGLDCYDPRTGAWRHFAVSKDGITRCKDDTALVKSNPVNAVVSDDFGGIWLAAIWAGIFRLDPETETWIAHRHDSTDAASLPHNLHNWLAVSHFRQGRPGAQGESQSAGSIVWIPSGAEGIYRIIVRRSPCTTAWVRPPAGIQGFAVSALAQESRGKIWAVPYNGALGVFDLPARSWTTHPGAPAKFGIYHLCRLRDGTMLVSTRIKKAWTYEARGDSFLPFLPDLNVTCFLEGPDSLLWLGCTGLTGMSFVATLDRRTGHVIVHPRQDPDSASHRDESVDRMCVDESNRLWYGTTGGGLIRFDLRQRTYRRFAGAPGSDSALISNGVTALVPDSGGKLWVGTVAGLALMDRERGVFEHMHNNLQEDTEPNIGEIADDGRGHLWIAAKEGAFCFTKATGTFRMLPPPAQFPTNSFWSVLFDPQTRMVTFGGVNGIFQFPADDPPSPSPPPPVVLTSFRVFDKPYPLEAEISYLPSITLPHAASFFSFTFAALDYIKPSKNRYAYQLEGVDPEWVQAGTRRYVSYTNLDPGTYTFKVRGANSEGVWSEEARAITILVLPPWYRTLWAYAGYVLLAGSLLFLVRRFDRRRVALKHSLEMKSFEAEKMREVDQMKSAFFSSISHEFRTPLTLILGPLEQFAERFKHDERTLATVSMMHRNGLRLLQLINQLLDLSKMDAGRMTVRVRLLEHVALARALVMSFQSLAERKQISLLFEPEEDEITGYTDRDKFEKILTNLLSNAFKFTGEGGEIRVTLRTFGGGVGPRSTTAAMDRGPAIELVVADTGIGIPPEEVGKIFDRFYQIESSHTQKAGGTGIGLALVKELVELLKGEITVESTPREGSTFTVRLPVGKTAWRTEEIAAEEAVPTAPGATEGLTGGAHVWEGEPSGAPAEDVQREPGKPVVLVVEDNADVRSYVRGFLEKQYSVEEAENGSQGLEKAREKGIDLVVSDIMMPVMDGVRLCRELKGDERTSHIPILLLTARASSEGKLEGLDAGADDYVVKPFDARELVARVKNLIDTRRKLWEKYHRQVTLGPEQIPLASMDERFLKRLAEHIEKHIADAGYDTEALAHDMCMSRMQLNRKTHALTGKSTHEVVREFRLQRAAAMLRRQADNITGIAYDVGFSSLSHFAHAFRERFGVSPSEYAARKPATEEEETTR